MKPWIGIVLVTALSGCGTVRTVSEESKAVGDLAEWNSYCPAIPRVYSGVAYQFCNLTGPERTGIHSHPYEILVDMAASCIADTVVLPYTSYKQYKYGNMVIPSFSLQMHQEPAQSGGSK
ncbi:YceK/YidQ family lipoprotein [Pseudomonas putida]|uniref:YceK/YidQ family lipoprotein n=1 Tax=Pseudomonas putida TaxID=303 RepID=UPI0018D8CC18|nr:YceK/YidQ family lipoprotein [Pseudomonas putida]MBH3416422.1 YceK/YidQ family lipoprotein [Pseudomonas putida]MDG9813694.1 YceK/YidQ family lipoprotein [Pseudomonas putida]